VRLNQFSRFSCRGRQEKKGKGREGKGREGKEREGKGRHKKSRKCYISPIRGEASHKRIFTKFCTSGDMLDVIICVNFGVEKLRGLGNTRGQILEFPIEMAGHLYNRAGATVQPVMSVEAPGNTRSFGTYT